MSLTAMGTIATTVIVSQAPDLSGNFVCDGTADEVEINAAVAYVNALGGGTIIILQATYITAAPITGANNVGFEGVGRNTLIQPGAAVGNAFTITGFTNVFIRNLAIDTKTSASTGDCIYLEDGCDNFLIDNVNFIDSDSYSIEISGTNIVGGIITNCVFLASDDVAVRSNMDAGNFWHQGTISNNVMFAGLYFCYIIEGDHVSIIGNTMQGGLNGIYVEAGFNYIISDNSIRDFTGDGITCAGSPYTIVSNNNIENAGVDGIYLITGSNYSVTGNYVILSGEHGIRSDAPDSTISDNICFDSSQDAAGTFHEIYVTGNADRCIVSDNHLSSPGDSSEDCIHLADGAAQVSITGNYCYNCMGSCISLTANNVNCTISNNTCHTPDDFGIETAANTCLYNLISNNMIISTGDNGINCNGDYAIISSNYIHNAGSFGIFLFFVDYSNISGNYIYDSTDDGINSNGSNNSFVGNFLWDVGDFGIWSDGSFTLCSGNYIHNSADDGIIINSARPLIVGNYLNSVNGTGIQTNGVDALVSGNYIEACSQASIAISGNQATVQNNYIQESGGNSINIASGDTQYITDNYINNTTNGIVITVGTTNITVKDNLFFSVTNPVTDGGTDSVFHGVEFFVANNDQQLGQVPGKTLTNGQAAYIPIHAPCGMQQLMSFHIHVIPQATQANANWDLATDYGAIGEAYNIHSETEAAATYNVTNLEWFEIDALAAGMLAAFGNGDSGGISLTVGTAGHNVAVVFGHLSYV